MLSYYVDTEQNENDVQTAHVPAPFTVQYFKMCKTEGWTLIGEQVCGMMTGAYSPWNRVSNLLLFLLPNLPHFPYRRTRSF